jgi:hypothetical protein
MMLLELNYQSSSLSGERKQRPGRRNGCYSTIPESQKKGAGIMVAKVEHYSELHRKMIDDRKLLFAMRCPV